MNRRLTLFLLLFLSVTYSWANPSKAKACTEFLIENSDAHVRYGFVRRGESAFDVVAAPTVASPEKYIQVYSEKGLTDINSKTGACNFSAKRNNVPSNRKEMLLKLYQEKVDFYEAKKAVVTNDPKIIPAAKNIFLETQRRLLGLLVTNCSDGFGEVRDYLRQKGQLPNVLVPDPNVGPVDPGSMEERPLGEVK